MDKTIPHQKNVSARNQKRFLKNQLKNQSLNEASTQKTSNSSDIDVLAKTKQTEQKNFSARNQKRFLKNQLKHQSLIENSTQKTSNSSDIDCLAKTNQTKAIETALNQTSCDSGVMLFSTSKEALAPKENGDNFETKIKNGPDLLAHRKLLKQKSELNSESKNESKSGSEENKTFKSVALETKKPKIKDYYKDTLAQRELLKLEENVSLETNKIEATPVAGKLSEIMDKTIIIENSSQISSKRKLLKSDSLEAKKPKSQRRDKSEEILNNEIETTGKLSEIMDKAIIIENSSQKVSNSSEIDSDQESCDLDLGVKLFSASKGAFVPKTIVETKIQVRPDLLAHRKLLINCDSGSDSEENEAFKSVAVSPEWVLEQRGYYKGPDESKLITEM